MKQVEEAERRPRERQKQAAEQRRRERVRERAKARQQARQAAKDESRAIVKAWNEAYALEAFFTELSSCAAAIDGEERADFEGRIRAARELLGGRDAIERFLQWTMPDDAEPDEDVDQLTRTEARKTRNPVREDVRD